MLFAELVESTKEKSNGWTSMLPVEFKLLGMVVSSFLGWYAIETEVPKIVEV